MTDTATSSKRAEANRRNAQKSTGPRTPEGKARSRFNAVKHGMRAQSDVLPGEDPTAFQHRLDRWTAELKPADEVETFLVGRAVRLSWQLERADRALDDRDAEAEAARRAEVADEVLATGRRLFWDPRGPLVSYPFRPEPGFLPHRVSWSGQVDDPDDPARLLVRLESTAIGCAWLLDQWAELRAVLEEGAAWQPPERFRAVRLLGRQPLDLLTDPRVLTVYLAGAAAGAAEADEFLDLVAELGDAERDRVVARIRERAKAVGRPADGEAGRAKLLTLIADEEARLEEVLAGHLEASPGEAVGFDAGVEGERLRRYQQACDRGLLRVLEALRRRQRERAGVGAATGGRRRAAAPEPTAADRARESERRLLELMKLMGPEQFRRALRPHDADRGPVSARGGAAGEVPSPGPVASRPTATIEANGPAEGSAASTNEANAPTVAAARPASWAVRTLSILLLAAGLWAAGAVGAGVGIRSEGAGRPVLRPDPARPGSADGAASSRRPQRPGSPPTAEPTGTPDSSPPMARCAPIRA